MGEESVIVTRDSSGQLKAFLNTCRHRGMRVCRADKGSTAAFTCSYHAWTYDTTGALIGVPKYKDAYYGEFDKSQWGLLPVAKVEAYKGLIFGTFDPAAPPLLDYLGDMTYYMDLVLDRREGGTELIGGVHRWVMKANWKVGCDNNSGDWYHVPFTHASIGKINLNRSPGAGGSQPFAPDSPNRYQVSAHPGHTLVVFVADSPEAASRGHSPLVRDYYIRSIPETTERLGELRARMVFIAGNVFPNLSWVPGSHTIRLYQPRGPEAMEIWSFCVVDRAAPPEVKAAIRRDYVRRFGPSGMLEQDDGENWSQVSASSRSALARKLEFNYQMGLGHERYHEEMPGEVGKAAGELTHRSFYLRWAAEMGIQSFRSQPRPVGNGQ
jgi:phenylpropionate dioxygenase-like ring-hydroxylating dioxygenase large terminal subunit